MIAWQGKHYQLACVEYFKSCTWSKSGNSGVVGAGGYIRVCKDCMEVISELHREYIGGIWGQ